MNDPQPPPLDAEDTALEAELEQLKPLAMPSDLRETTLGALDPSLSASELSLEADLGSLRPKAPDSKLWQSLEARLQDEEPEPNNVVSIPQWQDFIPVFKVAAIITIGLFAAWSIKKDVSQEAGSSVATEDSSPNPSGQYVPVNRSGTIQGTRHVGFLEKDNRVYQRQMETRQDRSHYRIDETMQVEDEVTRQREVISRLRTY